MKFYEHEDFKLLVKAIVFEIFYMLILEQF